MIYTTCISFSKTEVADMELGVNKRNIYYTIDEATGEPIMTSIKRPL